MGFAEETLAFNARAKGSMREFLLNKTWEEKVESIERMNAARKIARAAMKDAMEKLTSDAKLKPE